MSPEELERAKAKAQAESAMDRAWTEAREQMPVLEAISAEAVTPSPMYVKYMASLILGRLYYLKGERTELDERDEEKP